ncbi:hypothetical protein AB6E89_12635 [Vibrio breoganii]
MNKIDTYLTRVDKTECLLYEELASQLKVILEAQDKQALLQMIGQVSGRNLSFEKVLVQVRNQMPQ